MQERDDLPARWAVDPIEMRAGELDGFGRFVIRKTHTTGIDNPRRPMVLITRDPRDVAVSIKYYMHYTKLRHAIQSMTYGGTDYDYWPEVKGPPAMYINWINSWEATDAVRVRYEHLATHPIETLMGVFNSLGLSVHGAIIERAVDRQNFRKVRDSDPERFSHSMRKGIVGDWRNEFSHADMKLFHLIYGNFMVQNGYVSIKGSWQDGLKEDMEYGRE